MREARTRLRIARLPVLAGLLLLLAPWAGAAYDIRYEAQILPDRGTARLSIAVTQTDGVLRELSFDVQPERLFDETADGELTREEPVVEEQGEVLGLRQADEEAAPAALPRLVWRVPRGGGVLRYSLRVDRVREGAEYDARCASRWMVARAEDLFPPMAARFAPDSDMEASATLRFKLPPRWKVAHPFPIRNGLAVIEQSHRRLDQPKGWIVAGMIERLSADLEGTRILMAAPTGHAARLRDTLAFLRWTLPAMHAAFGALPDRIFIASAGNPMWRGGLSAPGSVYVHADRPLIDDDASSPLLHELVHTITRARSAPGEDWIVEGIAEHYSREILRRSGGISDETFEETLEKLRRRGANVRRLVGEATGKETALAVAFFHDLDEQIRRASEGGASLDDVVATLVDDVSTLDRDELAARILAETGYDPASLIEARIPEAESVARLGGAR